MARQDFAAVRIVGSMPVLPRGGRAIFVANHCGWWDGLLLLLLQRRLLPGIPVYSVMLAREFYSTFWFRLIGCLPITQGSTASIRQLLKRLTRLKQEQAESGYICSYFPQGEIRPSFVRPLGFTNGLRAVAAAMSPVTIIPIGIHYEPMVDRKPQAIISIGQALDQRSGDLDVGGVESAVTKSLDLIFAELTKHGEHLFREGRGPGFLDLI